MSKFVQVQTQLRDPKHIKQALDKLQVTYREDTKYVHRWSGHSFNVPLLVEVGRLSFGLRPTESGEFEVVGDEMQMRSIKSALEQITQQYAYCMVVEQTANAGFEIVDEHVANDNTIRMTVRRWS